MVCGGGFCPCFVGFRLLFSGFLSGFGFLPGGAVGVVDWSGAVEFGLTESGNDESWSGGIDPGVTLGPNGDSGCPGFLWLELPGFA